jgi:UDP-2-acetamido-2,6-beta-L-arabino-hexul-4-ose reductase
VRALVTGANGFLGKNLCVRLTETDGVEVLPFTRGHSLDELGDAVGAADVVFHLAGVNRPKDPAELDANADLTRAVCERVSATGRPTPIVYSSSTQADRGNPYGKSKLAAEAVLRDWHAETGSPVHIYRLPNVFGKWSRPDYNSVVATFCHNVSRGLPIRIDDEDRVLTLVHVDDVVATFTRHVRERIPGCASHAISPQYSLSVGELAAILGEFRESRDSLTLGGVGQGLKRALYATYMSYLPPEAFSYSLPVHSDDRGRFVEVLRTLDCGQFSFFSAPPGVTRGGHYHHSKTEKFVVIAGSARFSFRHVVSGETHEVTSSAGAPRVVETIPGWAHSITNVGREEMVVMLWANERFDPDAPDTHAFPV